MIESKELAYILRHHPEEYGLTPDEFGWISVADLVHAKHWKRSELEQVVANNTRFFFNEYKTKIKAAHGHSFPVIAENEQVPPEYLYHGTATRFIDDIYRDDLKAMTRTYLHLSETADAAKLIGMHYGKPIVLKIYAKALYRDGWKFYKSEDGVWLTTDIPHEYFDIEYGRN